MNPLQRSGGESARAEAQRVSERLERLIFMKRLIHDLNNSLSVITVDVGLLRTQQARDDLVAELLQEMTEAAAKASTLTGQLRRLVNEAVESLPDRDPGTAGPEPRGREPGTRGRPR